MTEILFFDKIGILKGAKLLSATETNEHIIKSFITSISQAILHTTYLSNIFMLCLFFLSKHNNVHYQSLLLLIW